MDKTMNPDNDKNKGGEQKESEEKKFNITRFDKKVLNTLTQMGRFKDVDAVKEELKARTGFDEPLLNRTLAHITHETGARTPFRMYLWANKHRTLLDPFYGVKVKGAPGREIIKLDPREQEVALLFGVGCSDKMIAETLNMNPSTVRSHVASIKIKFKTKDRDAVKAYLREHPEVLEN